MFLQRCLIVTWLVPRETAAVWPHSVYTIQPYILSFTSYKATYVGCRRVVTCHLHFWQIFYVLLRWNGYRKKNQHRGLTWRRKFPRRSCRDSNPIPFDHESGARTTELSQLPNLAGYSQTLMYLKRTRPCVVQGCIVRAVTAAVFMWHQPCSNQTAL